ncbi:Uncharacterized protein APZ42_013419 [Daphnia magna]|uniref:Uncharacterized protein n=1 Tax=Daphnia magna TaxID=35525 RepID=A0A162QZ11_9CRUS|nr:Uncharacterized protein APZ42_013419 [Daphnia magna]
MATLHPSLIGLMFLNRFSSCANKKNQTKATSFVSDLHWIEVEFLIFATKKKREEEKNSCVSQPLGRLPAPLGFLPTKGEHKPRTNFKTLQPNLWNNFGLENTPSSALRSVPAHKNRSTKCLFFAEFQVSERSAENKKRISKK